MKITKESVQQARLDFTAAHSLEKPNALGRSALRANTHKEVVRILNKFRNDDYADLIAPFPLPPRY